MAPGSVRKRRSALQSYNAWTAGLLSRLKGYLRRHAQAPLDAQYRGTPVSGSNAGEDGPATFSVNNPELSGFDPIGDNWLLQEPGRPVLYLWGVGPARRTWIARFFPEYRTAFARSDAAWSDQQKSLDLVERPSLAVWGRAKDHVIVHYAESRGVGILRLDEGFLTSVSAGGVANQPLSLIVDQTGIYFEGDTASDLERILQTHDFDADAKLVEKAGMLRSLYRHLKIAKQGGSVPIISQAKLGPKTRKRVLVLGQLFNSGQLLELARSDFPQAELLYFPHRDIAAKLRTHPDELNELSGDCVVILDDVEAADLFSAVDHVYTINSALGVDALFYGCKVTVTGAPFYAGWGLTDDRAQLPRRGRSLTLDQLFCGAYLLYSRYLPDLEDPVIGCLSAMLYIAGRRKQSILRFLKPSDVIAQVSADTYSRYWPILLRWGAEKTLGESSTKLWGTLLPKLYAQETGPLYQKSLAYLLLGALSQSIPPEIIYQKIKDHLSLQARATVLSDLLQMHPSDDLKAQWAVCCEKSGDTDQARQVLTALISPPLVADESEPNLPIPSERQPYLLQLAQLELQNRNLGQAEHLFNRLLLSGNQSGEVFYGLSEIARLRFDFRSAVDLMSVFNLLSPGWKAGRGAILEAQMAAYASDAARAAEAYAWACVMNAEYADSNALSVVADVLKSKVGHLNYGEAMHKAIEATGQGSVLGRAKALIAYGRPDVAEAMLLSYKPLPAENQKYCLTLSQAYTYQGKLEVAKSLINNWLPHHPTLAIYREGFQLAVLKNDYAWGWELFCEAGKRNLDAGDSNARKLLLGLGKIRESYLTFRDMRASDMLKHYLGARYVKTFEDMSTASRTTILACFGPGDEIRFANFYGEFKARLSTQSVEISCDPRLYKLLQRSYPEIKFLPVARCRSLVNVADRSNFSELPGADLHVFADNLGWKTLLKSDRFSLVTDLLGEVIDGYESFSGLAALRADEISAQTWSDRTRTARGGLLIGISWRSSLTTNFRNQHYLTIEELAPLFEIPGVRFVNLQYDDCSDELAWVEGRFPGKLLHFPELDQYNDLDGVAALMANLDLVIAPCTTVLELAGALGRPAFLLSNSSELHWRKRPGTMIDVWHGSVEHVESAVLGDKTSLVSNLVKRVSATATEHQSRTQRYAS